MSSKDRSFIKVEIPVELRKKLEEKMRAKGFVTLSEYIRYILRREVGEEQ